KSRPNNKQRCWLIWRTRIDIARERRTGGTFSNSSASTQSSASTLRASGWRRSPIPASSNIGAKRQGARTSTIQNINACRRRAIERIGSRIEDRGSRIEGRGSRIEDRGSRVEDRGSKIEWQ